MSNEFDDSNMIDEAIIGQAAPDFKATAVVNGQFKDISLSDYKGKAVVLNIFPSIDTGTCAQSVRQFNKDLNDIDDVVVLCILYIIFIEQYKIILFGWLIKNIFTLALFLYF